MAERNGPQGNLDSIYSDHEFVGETVFELDDPACSPALSTDLTGEEGAGEALSASRPHLHTTEDSPWAMAGNPSWIGLEVTPLLCSVGLI